MNLVLHLTPELEARLDEQAKATGKSREEIAMTTLQGSLTEAAANGTAIMSLESWLHEFDTWVADHESRNPRLDDSRESIYPDRW